MPILLLLALGGAAAVFFIVSKDAGATKKKILTITSTPLEVIVCSDETLSKLILTGIAIFKQRVDGKIRISPEEEKKAQTLSRECQGQLAAFLKKNPATANELRKAQQAFLQRENLLAAKVLLR